MREREVLFDRRCHVIYSPKCKEEIFKKIRLHYSAEKVAEIEEMNNHLFLPAFEKLGFVDCNKEIYKRLMYISFKIAERKCRKWNDYTMKVSPYQKGEPIRYEFTTCPIAEFAKEQDLLDLLPAFCNGDYKAMELIHARLVRRTTCGNGSVCDYAIYGDQDERLWGHTEYVNTGGYRTNL